jgi:transposase
VLLRPESWGRYGFGHWLRAAASRLHRNVLAVALANKLARLAWGVLHGERGYEPGVQARAA